MGISPAVIAALAVSATATAGSVIATNKAAEKQNDAQEKARRAEQRTASLENARRARLAIAQRRIRAAEITQAGFDSGAEGSSAVAGARGALVSDTASNIGAFNTQIAGNQATNEALLKGARGFAKFQGISNAFSGVANISSSIGQAAAFKAGTKSVK